MPHRRASDHDEIVSRDDRALAERTDASVLTLLHAFDALEHALHRLGAADVASDVVLETAVARVHAALGDEPAPDLAVQMRALLDALRDLTPASPRPRANFRPPLR